MGLYLVESFVGSATAVDCAARAGLARAAAVAAGRNGAAVRFVDWMLVPEDEICFYFFTAGSHADVARVSEHAGLGHDRIVAAL
jgi:hypothetical protein